MGREKVNRQGGTRGEGRGKINTGRGIERSGLERRGIEKRSSGRKTT